MDEYTEHIDGVLARIESEWPKPTADAVFKIAHLTVRPTNADELFAALEDFARKKRGLQ